MANADKNIKITPSRNKVTTPKIVFTGYTLEEIKKDPQLESCLKYIDVLIDGRYIDEKRISSSLAGSSNQEFHFLSFCFCV